MTLKNLYNLITNRKSLLHSDRFVYMAGTSSGGGGADDQGNPVTADDQDESALAEAEGLAVSEEAKKKAAEELSKIAETVKSMNVYSENTDNGLFSDFDNHIVEIGDHDSNIKYLLWLENRIQTKGGKWFLPQEDGIATQIGKHVDEISALYAKLSPGVVSEGGTSFNKISVSGSATRKEALPLIKELRIRAQEAREASRKKFIDRVDKTLLDTIQKIDDRVVMDNKQGTKDDLVAAAREQLVVLRSNDDPFEKKYKDRMTMAAYLRTKDKQLWESEKDKEALPALSPEGLRTRMKKLRDKKEQEVTPYLGIIQTKMKALQSKLDGKVKSTIESVFSDNPELKEEHLERLEKVKKDLNCWEDIEFFDTVLRSTAGIDPSEMVDPMGGLLSDKALKSKDIGAEDWIALAEMSGVSESVKNSALLTASDLLAAVEQTIGKPKEFAETQLDDYSLELDRYMTDLTEKGDKVGGYRIYFLSMYDFKHMGEKLVEWAKRKYNRRSDKLLGEFGSSLLSGLPGPLKTAANEFDRLSEQSEQEEVNQYKESYSNKDAWQVIEVMHTTKNQDEMKACMFLLADLGRIRWDDPRLWEQLMYFGHGAIQFNIKDPESELRNQGRLHDKLQKIVGVIWDFDTFQSWQTTNESSYSSKMESHKDFCDKNAEMPGALDLILAQDLAQFKKDKKAGNVPKVDPQRFEKLIHYNIEFGKGSPEGKLYYLIQGIACGLLSQDTASRFNSKWINNYPVIDIFGSEEEGFEKPNMDAIRKWARLDGDRNVPGKAFHRWFHADVLHRPRVYQRINKALTQGMGQDHDDATCWFGGMDANTAKQILSKNAQGFSMPVTGYQNATVGMLQYLDTIMESYSTLGEVRTNETSAFNQVIRFANMFATFDGITSSRMLKNDTNHFKWNGEQYKAPRAAGAYGDSYGHGADKKTQDNIDTMRKYLTMLDPEFFDFMFNTSQRAAPQEVEKFCTKRAKHFKDKHGIENIFGNAGIPKNSDQLHQSVGEYLRNILETSEGYSNLHEMKRKITNDHDTFDAAQKAKDSLHLTVTEQYNNHMSRETESTAYGGVDVSESDRQNLIRLFPGKSKK